MSPIKGSFPSLSSSYSPARVTAALPKMPDIKSLNLDPMPTRYYEEDPNYKQALSTWQAQKPKRADYGSQRSFNITLNAWKKKEPSMYGKFYKPEATYNQEAADWRRAKSSAIDAWKAKQRTVLSISPVSENKMKELLLESQKLKSFNVEGTAQALLKKEEERVAELMMQAKADSYPVRVKAQRELDKYAKEGVLGLDIELPKTKDERDAVVAQMSEIRGKLEILEKEKALQAAKEERVAGFKHELTIDKLERTWANTKERDADLLEARKEIKAYQSMIDEPIKMAELTLKIGGMQNKALNDAENLRLRNITTSIAQAQLQLDQLDAAAKTPEVKMIQVQLAEKMKNIANISKEIVDYSGYGKNKVAQGKLDTLVPMYEKAMKEAEDLRSQFSSSVSQQDQAGWEAQQKADNPLGANNQFIQEPTQQFDFSSVLEGLPEAMQGARERPPVTQQTPQQAPQPPPQQPNIQEPPMVGKEEVDSKWVLDIKKRKQVLDAVDSYLADWNDNQRLDAVNAGQIEAWLLQIVEGPIAKANPGLAKKAEAALRTTGKM